MTIGVVQSVFPGYSQIAFLFKPIKRLHWEVRERLGRVTPFAKDKEPSEPGANRPVTVELVRKRHPPKGTISGGGRNELLGIVRTREHQLGKRAERKAVGDEL